MVYHLSPQCGVRPDHRTGGRVDRGGKPARRLYLCFSYGTSICRAGPSVPAGREPYGLCLSAVSAALPYQRGLYSIVVRLYKRADLGGYGSGRLERGGGATPSAPVAVRRAQALYGRDRVGDSVRRMGGFGSRLRLCCSGLLCADGLSVRRFLRSRRIYRTGTNRSALSLVPDGILRR